jgi:hypothetical protein
MVAKRNILHNEIPFLQGMAVRFRNVNWSIETTIDDGGEIVVYVLSPTHGIIDQVILESADPEYGSDRVPTYIRSKVRGLFRLPPQIAA